MQHTLVLYDWGPAGSSAILVLPYEGCLMFCFLIISLQCFFSSTTDARGFSFTLSADPTGLLALSVLFCCSEIRLCHFYSFFI